MNEKGVAAVPILVVLGLLLIGGAFWVMSSMSQPSTVNIVNQIASPTSQPNESDPTKPISSRPITPTVVPIKSTCNTTKDVCFESANPTVTIQEGYLEDASHWISDQLMLIGKGSKGYEVKISGFPKEFTVRVPESSFSDGSKTKVYLRAQKNVAKKGTYKGTITAKSLMTNVTTSADLTLNYSDWGPEAIHTDLVDIRLDCTVKYAANGVNSRELDCDKESDERSVKFYYFKNDKTIEIRNVPESSKDSRSIELVLDSTNSTTLNKGQDIYALHFNPTGFDMDNLNTEVDGTYKGYFSFVDQSNQKEVTRTPYALTVHAFKQ